MDRKLFFGEYLIARGLVTEQDVLEALAEQKRLVQSFEKTALDYGFLSMKQVFSILTRQAASDLSFEQITELAEMEEEGLIHLEQGTLRITKLGMTFLRNICMIFDLKLRREQRQSEELFSKSI